MLMKLIILLQRHEIQTRYTVTSVVRIEFTRVMANQFKLVRFVLNPSRHNTLVRKFSSIRLSKMRISRVISFCLWLDGSYYSIRKQNAQRKF